MLASPPGIYQYESGRFEEDKDMNNRAQQQQHYHVKIAQNANSLEDSNVTVDINPTAPLRTRNPLSSPKDVNNIFNDQCIALDSSNGDEIWRSLTSSESLSPPVNSGSHIIIQTVDGRISGYNLKSGKRDWFHQTVLPTLTLSRSVAE